MEWLKANYGTILVVAVLAVIVVLIVLNIRKDKKNGKGTCGGNCASCHGGCSHGSGTAQLFRITAKIDGMSCSMCETHVNDAIRNSIKVKKISSDAKKGETVFVCDTPINDVELKKILDPTGYRVLSVKIQPLV